MFCTNIATKLTPISSTVQDLLLKYPRGRYTVCRTLDQKIIDWSFHKARLFPNPSLEPLISTSIKEYFKSSHKEAKITILTVNDSNGSILLHFSEFIPFPTNVPVSCLVANNDTARSNPNVKDSLWIADRKPIVDQKYHETILVSPNGDILEGSTSNLVFILSDHTLITAPVDAVLPGSVLSLVASVAEISYRFTNRREHMEWKGAFLTSTSRVLVPVGEFVFSQDGFKVSFSSDSLEFLNELRAKVYDEMANRAKEIELIS